MTTMTKQVVDAKGRVKAVTVVPDGHTVRVPLHLTDAAARAAAVADGSPVGRYEPGSLPVSDADRARRVALYATHDAMLSQRWKGGAA